MWFIAQVQYLEIPYAMKTKTFTQVFLLFPYKLLCSFLLSFTKIFSFSSRREERGVLAKNSFVGESSPRSNRIARFWGDDVINFQQIASFSKVIALKGRVAIFAVLQNFMEAISTHTAALLALQKRIFLQNTQSGPTAHSRGWKLKGISLGGFTLSLILILFIGLKGWGQTTSSEINGGNTSYGNTDAAPVDTYYGYNYTQMIFTASELTSAGLTSGSSISGLLFYYATDGGNEADFDDWVIYLGNTSTSSFNTSTSWISTSNMSSVFNSTVTFPAAGSWMTINFSSNFTWNGTSNLVIAVDENSPGYGSNVYPWSATNVSGSNSEVIYYADDVTNPNPVSPPTADGTYIWRPIIKLKYTNCTSASTYYSKSTGNLDLLSSWGTNADGSGTAPCNFTNASTIYYIANRTTATIGANWTVSGSGSKVIVGQASSAAVTFTVPNNYTYTGTIDVAAASIGSNTLVLYHTTVPTLGTLNIGSTVKFNASGIQTIPVNTYGNLETGVQSGSTNYTKTAAGILDINGNLTLGDYSTLALSSFSHTLAGDFIKPTGNGILSAGTSTLTFDGASTQKIHVTAAGGTTPCDADITYNNLVINGSDVKLYYNQVTNRKMNVLDLTVNANKLLTLFSAP